MIDRINTTNYTIRKAENNKQQSFKGPVTGALNGLRFLNDSPAIGACAVDLMSMVIPRTAIETKNRGKQSGFETFFRESASCIAHACVGLIGLGAATAISKNFNAQHGIKAQNIYASGNTIKNMSEIWQSSADNTEFFRTFVQNIKGLNGTTWKNVSAGAKEDVIVEGLVALADKSKELSNATGSAKKELGKQVKELRTSVLSAITKDTGAQASFKLNAVKDGTKEISASLSELVDNAVVLSNTFAEKSKDKLPEFVKGLTKNKTASTILGMAICSAICVSIQPFNRWLTKKRTGQDGFVGVENKQGDKSEKFKAAKTGLGVLFPAFAISTIGKPSNLISNVQFNSKVPTLNQFKLIYGLTIGSRFMSSRDSNELRESVIKDTLGFTNWLILGGMVSKLTARGLGGKELINNPVAEEGKKGIKYAAKWLTKASVKSFDEVLLPASKELTKDGKLLNFSQLFKNADPAVKSKVMKIAMSQVAGYLYSGIVLGVGISKLNIAITKHLQNKKNANNDMTQKVNSETTGNAKFDTAYLSKLKDSASPIFKEFN